METISSFCCVCINETDNLEKINQEYENNMNYSSKLAVCDPEQNWTDANLMLCKLCIERLNSAYKFIEICRNSEKFRLKKLLELQEQLESKATELHFQCALCQRVFNKKRGLKNHITRTHRIDSKVQSRVQSTLKKKVRKEKKGTLQSKKTESKVTGNILRDLLEDKNEEIKIEDTNFVKPEEKDDESINVTETKAECSDDKIDSFNENDVFSDSDNIEKPEEKVKKKRPGRKKRDKEPFTCQYCGKLFNRRQHWSAHIRAIHTFEKPYKCNQCDASFCNSHSLLVHRRNHNNEKPYICPVCGKAFVCSGDLFHHNKIHLNKKEYHCTVCDKRFNTTSILRAHKIVKHTDPKDWKYACNQCDKKFPLHSGLVTHMKRHSGVRDVSCHICGKMFFLKSEVTKHILSHSNQRQHKCSICGEKEYKNKEGLNKHLKLVHGLGNWKPPVQKTFPCPFCSKVFVYNNKLQRHMWTHTGEKPFGCEYCEARFCDSYNKRVHLKKKHNIDWEDIKNFSFKPEGPKDNYVTKVEVQFLDVEGCG